MNNQMKMCSPVKRDNIVERVLNNRIRTKRAQQYLALGCVNTLLFAVLAFDIFINDNAIETLWDYMKVGAAIVTALGVLSCFLKVVCNLLFRSQVQGTRQQLNLLSLDDSDSNLLKSTPKKCSTPSPTLDNSLPIECAASSWHPNLNDSNSSARGIFTRKYRSNNSPRRSPIMQRHRLNNSTTGYYQNNTSGGQFVYNSPLPAYNNNNSTLNNTSIRSVDEESFVSSFHKYMGHDFIMDKDGLKDYLKEVSQKENNSVDPTEMTPTTNYSMYSFWNYCNKTANLLRTSLYQLAPSTPPPKSRQQATEEDVLNIIDSNSEVIKKISSDKLSQYVTNLRRWISTTILVRLVKQIELLDAAFKAHGFFDMQIGNIGLERLRKTVENQQFVSQYFSMLPLILPFLELSSNQEYLVQRIKDLAKDTCIADFRWNSGGDYYGVRWDEHLPTDTAIIFHVFCVYMDTQLMPLPQGGGRPFHNRYVLLGEEKRPARTTIESVQNKANCAILCTNPIRPKFNFISDQEIHNCIYNRNNLFYVIIQFLIYMRTHQDSVLEGVNLGRSGINIMCVIED